MALGRQILDRPLDAAGNAVAGLPHAATGDAAERHDDVVAGDTANATAISVEIAARIAGDAAHPGTITALTGDVAASGTGSVAATLANLPQSVLLARTSALTADLPVNNHKITGLASGGTTTTNAANIGDVLAQAAISTANEADLTALDATNLGTGTRARVRTYRCFWVLDKVTTRTAIPNRVIAATGGSGWWWVRELANGDPFWQAQTAWWMDPAGTNSTPGNDEADGLSSSTPIKSLAEWRRRVNGAVFTGGVAINALSGSSNADDGEFYGFTTTPQTVFVSVIGVPQVVGSGTLTTGTTPYSGNNRALLVDSAVPTGTWLGAGYITTTSRSRYIRKTGGGAVQHAPLLLDTSSTLAHSAMPGIATNINDAVVSFFPSPNETSFSSGDSYEVYGLPSWPQLQVANLAAVAVQNCDIFPVSNPTGPGATKYRLCGIVGTAATFAAITGSGSSNMYMCCFAILQPAGVAFTGPNWVIGNCAFLNTLFAVSGGGPDLVFVASNVFVNGFNRYYKGCNLSVANFRHYDFAAHPLLQVESAARVSIEGGFVGSGNSTKLASVNLGAVVQGVSGLTATTTDALPWQVSGVSYAAPIVDGGSGNGIYN